MFEMLKKTILFGAGLASMTGEKLEKFVDEMVKKGEISEKEGRELVDDLIARSKKARADLEAKISATVEKTMERLNVPSRSEIEKLRARIEELERAKEDKGDKGDK